MDPKKLNVKPSCSGHTAQQSGHTAGVQNANKMPGIFGLFLYTIVKIKMNEFDD